MLDVSTTPLSPAIAVMSIQERMLAVVRRINPLGDPDNGPSVSLDDFQRAEETCDLTDSQISVNIGAVKRLARQAAEAKVEPIAPAKPWELYPDYRKQRVADAAVHLAGMIPSETDRFALLRQCEFEADEIGALWDEITAEAARLIAGHRNGLMARIIVDLTLITDRFERCDGDAADKELVLSLRVGLDALQGNVTVPRAHVVQTFRALLPRLHDTDIDERLVENACKACAALAELWGV
ncbi:MAG: hypothetical protein EOP24_34300 [Hyphomicrobiales bacterium]|nr:MAG: hypothetical protein EOP24_34300 [Hyphomicrobiales bacterium]